MPTPSAGTVWLPSKATPTSSDRHANHHFEAAGVGADAIDALRRRLSYSSARFRRPMSIRRLCFPLRATNRHSRMFGRYPAAREEPCGQRGPASVSVGRLEAIRRSIMGYREAPVVGYESQSLCS